MKKYSTIGLDRFVSRAHEVENEVYKNVWSENQWNKYWGSPVRMTFGACKKLFEAKFVLYSWVNKCCKVQLHVINIQYTLHLILLFIYALIIVILAIVS